MEDLPGNVPVVSREEVLPEVNELSHLKLEELCNKTGGRGCHTVSSSVPIMEDSAHQLLKHQSLQSHPVYPCLCPPS